MSDLTPIPDEQRRAYYDALRAGRAEAERLGYGPMDDRVFAAFHRALYRPMIDAARADERAKTAEGIARAIEIEYQRTDVMVISGWGDGMADAAAIARQHANPRPDDPSHGQNAHMPGEQTPDGTNGGPESHAEPRTPPTA